MTGRLRGRLFGLDAPGSGDARRRVVAVSGADVDISTMDRSWKRMGLLWRSVLDERTRSARESNPATNKDGGHNWLARLGSDPTHCIVNICAAKARALSEFGSVPRH